MPPRPIRPRARLPRPTALAAVLALAAALWAPGGRAAPEDAPVDAPVVMADIPPVQSLVARVMEGVGEPGLILPPGADPHHHALRPSDAASLQEARAVFWVGPALTPWLEAPLASLAAGAEVVALLDLAPVRHASREGALLADDGDHGGHDHDHGPVDPHAWLDPTNAAAWMDAIAEALAAVDPERADAYRANAAAGRAEALALVDAVEAALPEDAAFVVSHDAYAYFERRFGARAAGAIAASDAERPGPRRLRALGGAADCVLAEPGHDPGLVRAALGEDARVVIADPLGADLPPGPGLYPALIREVAAAVASCAEAG